MHNHITICTNFDNSVFVETEASLGEWTSEENLQIPNLVGMVGRRLKLDASLVAEIDPIVRRYVRTHPDWRVSRGAKGGLQRKVVWEKKLSEKAALEAAKKVVAAQVAAKIKGVVPVPSTLDVTTSVTNDNDDEDLGL